MISPLDADTAGFPTAEMSIFPNIVNIEVFRGACPCSCPHCPVGNVPAAARREHFGYGSIALPLWNRLTAEIACYPWSVARLHSVGDPILWADLPAALRSAHVLGCRTWLFTSLVTSASALLDAVRDHASIVEISVNSIAPDDYAATKGVDCFDLVLRNIRYLRAPARSGERARLIASRVESGDARADAEFIRFWKRSGLVDEAFARSFHSYNGLLSHRRGSPPEPRPCLVHWARCNISLDGQVVLCFNELFRKRIDPRLILGDANQSAIASIWRGETLRALRQAALCRDYRSLPFADVLPCSDCAYRQALGTSKPTSESQLLQIRRGQS